MGVRYDKDGNCETCGMPGQGFVEDGVCHCLDDDGGDDSDNINCDVNYEGGQDEA